MARITTQEVRLFQDAHLTKKAFFVGPNTVFMTPASSYSAEYQSFKVNNIACSEKTGGPYNLIKDGYLSVNGTAGHDDSVPDNGIPPVVPPVLTGPTIMEAGAALDTLVRFVKARL